MALIKCEECGKEISDKAKICPHCGNENDYVFCVECGSKMGKTADFCTKCGMKNEISGEISRSNNSSNSVGNGIGIATFSLILSIMGPFFPGDISIAACVVSFILSCVAIDINKKKSYSKKIALVSIFILLFWFFLYVGYMASS